jgi:AraC-like DNA-binding protein
MPMFKSLFPEGSCVELGDDFYILDVELTKKHNPLLHPCRFDGYMVIFCLSGEMRLNVNLNEVELKEQMLFVNVPGNIIKVTDLQRSGGNDPKYVVVAMTKEFMTGLMMNANKLFVEDLTRLEKPVITVTDAYYLQIQKHVELISSVLNSNVHHKAEIVNTQMSSLFYLISGLWSGTDKGAQDEPQAASGRTRMIFEQFLKLVKEYHTQYRNVGFYAEKLCLTPKYLSKLVKGATGQSAPEWIDAYVILEAKNLLKHSNISIKEIVYSLNFPNQSVFYKFFKMRTGMTPSEYRNS